MTLRGRHHLIKPLCFVTAMVALSGCISTTPDETGRYTAPIGGSPVIANETPYSDALRCMIGYTARKPIHIAVGQIADYTGKAESDSSGRKITQGGALMAMSALAKAGVPLVERFDTSVAELELKYANNKLIGGEKGPQGDYRKIFAGSIPGSDYYLVGGITELNFNIRSEGANADGGQTSTDGVKGLAGINAYVMNIGLDLRLVDTNTLEVVDVISYQKQIIGRQIQAGVFDFMGHSFLDVAAGDSALEPIQLAVRSVIERAVLEMMSRMYKTSGGSCASAIGTSADPLAGPGDAPRLPPSQPRVTTASTAPAQQRYDSYGTYAAPAQSQSHAPRQPQYSQPYAAPTTPVEQQQGYGAYADRGRNGAPPAQQYSQPRASRPAPRDQGYDNGAYADATDQGYAPRQPQYSQPRVTTAATTPREQRYDSSNRADPYRFYSSGDPASDPGLRRRYD